MEIEVAAETLRATSLGTAVRVVHEGKRIAAGTGPLREGKSRVPLVIEQPKLWWPAGMGAQPLYTVEVEPRQPMSPSEFTKALRVRSLYNTYAEL